MRRYVAVFLVLQNNDYYHENLVMQHLFNQCY